ncbi:MAG TPA: ATP-binding protein [Gaiellaceae bacterium]|nr:ATP-binding protein [Gaiellaceae bacterium]
MSEAGPDAEAAASSGGSNGQRRSWRESGLVARIAFSAIVVALGLAIVFGVLFLAILSLHQRSLDARRSQQVIATANRLQTYVIDLETGVRGFALTRQERYLDPWRSAQTHYPGAITTLVALTRDNPTQHSRALTIKTEIQAYFTDYSLPLVSFLRGNPALAPSVATDAHGRSQVEAIRRQFGRFLATEGALSAARNDRAQATTRNSLLVGGIGLGAALSLILIGAIYVSRAVARPVRLTAAAAARIAGGDLSERLDTDGPGEVGQLERTFNTMAASLERTVADLEERNRTLLESEQVKSELVSNVSHELRTPLASVLGFSSLMLDRDLPPEETKRYLEVIRTEARRLASLLNDLLDLQRVEQEALDLRSEEVDLNELLSSQVTLYSAQSDLHTLKFHPTGEALAVRGDRDRLAQVFGNLLSNAIKYSPDGGVVEVTATSIGDEAWVWVRDEGLGIPGGHQEQIFTKFFRGDVGRQLGIAGTGLGLVLARQIVEAHGGQIGFESEPGRGSTFWLQLPASHPSEDHPQEPSLATSRDDAEPRHRV